MFHHRFADVVLLSALLLLTVQVGVRAEPPSMDAYHQWLLSNLDAIQQDLPHITKVADEAAALYATGDYQLAAAGDYGVLAEACGRSGGIMDLKWGYPSNYRKHAGKYLVLYTLREDHLDDYVKDAKKHLAGDDVHLVAMGPTHLIERAKQAGMPIDASLEVHAAEHEGLFQNAAGEWVVPTTPPASMAVLWAWTGEFVAACTRRGKMPVMHQSYAVEGAFERAQQLKGQKFYKQEATPVPAGALGEQYLNRLRAELEHFYVKERGHLSRAVDMAWNHRQAGGTLFMFAHGHAIIMQQVNYPHSPGYFRQINNNWYTQNPKYTLEEGDFVFCLGYDDVYHAKRFEQWDDKARDAGATLVWCITDYKESAIASIRKHDELLINQHWAFGDAIVDVPGFDLKIAPSSGYLVQAIMRLMNADLLHRDVTEPASD